VPDAVAQAVGFPRLHTVPTDQIAVTVNVEPVWAQKMTAIRCHRTQRNASPILSADEQRKRIFLGQEHFTRFRARSDQDFLLDLFSRQRTFDDKKDFI
jgi:LmbE family N-acetylglucosaminyl deacetylase